MAGILHEDCAIKVWAKSGQHPETRPELDAHQRDIIMVNHTPEKQMIFLFVPMFEVSTRLIPGRLIPSRVFTSKAGGVIALGAMIKLDGQLGETWR
jgi:hypothetical protein